MRYNSVEVEDFYEFTALSDGFNSRTEELYSIAFDHDFFWMDVNSSLNIAYNHAAFSASTQFTAPGALAAISLPSSTDAFFVKADFGDYEDLRITLHNNWDYDEKSSFQFGAELGILRVSKARAANNFDLAAFSNGIIPIPYYGSLAETTTIQKSSRRKIIGIYGQLQRQLFEKTKLTLGFRYDDFPGIASQLSSRLALVHKLTENQSLKLLYGEAFRAPQDSELNLINNPVTVGNENLNPEKVQTWDLIWVGQWDNSSMSIGYFESHYEDSIVAVNDGLQGEKFENVSQDPSKGTELELSHEFTANWHLRLTYTYIFETPQATFREADQLASIICNYNKRKWNANVSAIYANERRSGEGANRIVLSDYWLLATKVSYDFNKSCRGFIQIKNLLDEKYFTPTSRSVLTTGVANRGREFLVGFSYSF